jgi:hypothetical protein
LKLAKIDLKKHRVSLSRDQENKRKHDDIHNHRLLEIAAREASSKQVKETAATHKTRIKEKALEASTQRTQTMMEMYQGTNLGQFPNGRTNLENVSIKNEHNLFYLLSTNSPLIFFHSFNRLSQT